MSDHELLQLYTRDHAQTAFASLVERHVNLVYSAARRQVRSPHLAEEVAQLVFVELARCAAKIPPTQPLAAWLYVVTRRTAIDAVRQEARRLAREAAAAEFAAMQTSPESWLKMEASLDEAMATLNDTQRTAIILRFFQNLSLREVGDALGISEDTAQKRVSRALDQLRAAFLRRGVAVSSSTFAATLSAHAVQAAPAGIAAAISSSAAAPTVAVAAAQQLAMATAQKTFATLAVAVALGLALYEAVPAARLHAEVQEGQRQLDSLAATARQLARAQTMAARELDRLNRQRSGAPAPPEPGSDAALAQAAAAWSARIARLKQAFAQHPEWAIPELQLLTDRDWVGAARSQNSSDEEMLPSDLRLLRTRAKSDFLDRLSEATRKYVATARALPERFDQLTPLLRPPIDPAIFARYDFLRETTWLVVAEKTAGAVDLDRLAIMANEYAGPAGRFNGFSRMESIAERSVRQAAQTYVTSHDGARPAHAAQLLPLLTEAVDPAKVEQISRNLPAWLQPTTAASP